VFFAGLPYILSYALGYKFNMRLLKFTKTGIIAIETQPAGADVYLNGTLLDKKTPATIQELLPGKYNIKIELEKHYPWSSDTEVYGGHVSRFDKVILFPLRPNVKKLNKDKISTFWVDEERGKIYYVDVKENVIYKSDLEGEDFQDIGSLPEITPAPKKWKLSPNRERLLFFNPSQLVIVSLKLEEGSSISDSAIVLNLGGRKIIDVFWHSDSYHMLVVTEKTVEVLEAQAETIPIELVRLNKKETKVFYDETKDALYFLDTQKAADDNYYDNVYKLELNVKSFPFQDLMRTKTNERPE
jgi:hypothetical protein